MLKKIAKSVVSLLTLCLMIEANSASCVLTYEPECPNDLAKFKNKRINEVDN